MEVIAEQALVRFSSTSAPAQREAVLSAAGARRLSELESIGWTLVALSSGMKVTSGIEILKPIPGVESVQPNHYYAPTRSASDPLIHTQYALSQINAFGAWDYEVGVSCRVTVAVIDTGVDITSLELSTTTGKVLSTQSRSFDADTGAVSASSPFSPACNHGTRVSGIAAASTDNGLGIAGLSWNGQVLALKVFNNNQCNPTGSCPTGCGTTDAALAAALNYAVTLQNTAAVGKIVVNMSIGGSGSCPGTCPGVDCYQTTKTALESAVAAGIPVVISAGNDGGAVNVPANCAGVLASGIIPVGATDSNNAVAGFSSRGSELAANGLVAPGVSVLTTDLNGNIASPTGTSFAAPHVAGIAALILSAKPGLSARDVQAALRGGTDNIGVSSLENDGRLGGRGNTSGAGRLNAFRAMRLAVRGTLADFDGDQQAIAIPNPFRPSQTGSVTLTVPLPLQGAKTEIRIYTMAGQLVRELPSGSWDGKNSEGIPVASGSYVFQVTTSQGNALGRVTVIR